MIKNRFEEIKNKYDFLFGEGNPETDSVADEDTSWLLCRIEELTVEINRLNEKYDLQYLVQRHDEMTEKNRSLEEELHKYKEALKVIGRESVSLKAYCKEVLSGGDK